MPSRDPSFFDRLQTMFNLLIGVTDTHTLPHAFREPAPWEIDPDGFQRPAVWRRRRQAR